MTNSTRTDTARALAEKIIDATAGYGPGERLTAMTIAMASLLAVSGRDDVSNKDLAMASAWSLQCALDEMRPDREGAELQ